MFTQNMLLSLLRQSKKKIPPCYRFINYVQGQSPEPNTREYFYYIDHQGMLAISQPCEATSRDSRTPAKIRSCYRGCHLTMCERCPALAPCNIFFEIVQELFLDDSKMKNFTSCFKDKKFLQFFFKRLQINNKGKYEDEFPYYSPCGNEKNFVRCDDVPIVFTHILNFMENGKESVEYLSYGHAGDLLTVKFEPKKICMLPTSGRVYHPGPEIIGGVGLIKSSLAIQLSQNFTYKDINNTDEAPLYFTWKEKKYSLTYEILQKLKNIKNI